MLNTEDYFQLVHDDGYHIEPIKDTRSISVSDLGSYYDPKEYNEEPIDFNCSSDVEFILNNEVFDGPAVLFDDDGHRCNTYSNDFVCKHEKTENGRVYFKIIMEY